MRYHEHLLDVHLFQLVTEQVVGTRLVGREPVGYGDVALEVARGTEYHATSPGALVSPSAGC